MKIREAETPSRGILLLLGACGSFFCTQTHTDAVFVIYAILTMLGKAQPPHTAFRQGRQLAAFYTFFFVENVIF